MAKTITALNVQKMKQCDFPIDAVYLWVDGADPEWQKKMQKAILKANEQSAEKVSLDSLAAARFRDNCELKYSLRSLELFAPWINKVHLITDGQCPAWLNLEQVNLVDHKDILPENAACPTFNSRTIELCMHRIANLSEHFLGFNDDFMLAAPVAKEDFFLPDGTPKIWLDLKRNKKRLKKENLVGRQLSDMLTRELICKQFGNFISHKIKHSPRAYTKKTMQDLWLTFPDEVERILHSQFRNPNSAIVITLYPLYLLETGKGKKYPINGIYQFLHFLKGKTFHIGASLGDANYKSKMNRIKLLKPLTFCINDSENASNLDREVLKTFLAEMFPNKSKYEL